jgi:hypothetical protein
MPRDVARFGASVERRFADKLQGGLNQFMNFSNKILDETFEPASVHRPAGLTASASASGVIIP